VVQVEIKDFKNLYLIAFKFKPQHMGLLMWCSLIFVKQFFRPYSTGRENLYKKYFSKCTKPRPCKKAWGEVAEMSTEMESNPMYLTN
jgi:hypothetical protein